jgi:tetratricopeptide (TPR) repeat protein
VSSGTCYDLKMTSVMVAAMLSAAMIAAVQSPGGPAGQLPAMDTASLPPDAATAIAQAYTAAERQPDDPALVGHLAMVLHAWEEWDSAAATYRLAQKLAPRDHRWWHLAGLLETRRGRHEEALHLFERAADLAPGELAVRLRVAEARLETGDLEGSERLFTELARHSSTVAAAEYGLGRAAMSRGDAAKALLHFDTAVAAYADFGAAHYGRAMALRRLGRTAEAAEALDRQQQCLPCWPAAGDAVAESLADVRKDAGAVLRRGIALARDGQDRLAIEAHERALALDPTLGQARVNLITLYGRAGEWARADAEYHEALRHGTHVAEAHANYAQVLLAERRAADAVPVFRRALEANAADARAWNGLGLALETTGDTAGASAAYRQAVVHAPTFRTARFNYARTLVAAGRLEEAIAELEKIRLPEDDETPRYLFALSAALVRAGKVERGRAEAVAALALARRYGQSDLAATIERDLALLNK